MKKFYFIILLFVFISGKAQLTLTKSANEPAIGDVYFKKGFDSTTSVPKTTGLNQVWNFTTLVTNFYTVTSTYTTVAATASPAVFPAATMAEDQGNTSFTMWKSTGTTFEIQGVQFPGTAVNFSNTAVVATWPVSMGYSATDAFSGSGPSGTTTATFSGNIAVNASGQGTVILPGGLTFTNCLQVVHSLTITQTIGAYSSTTRQKEYSYYHSAHKFPILSIVYTTDIDTSGITKTFIAFGNGIALSTSIRSHRDNFNFEVFPNPAKDIVTIKLDDNFKDSARYTLYNKMGHVVRNQEKNNTIELRDLPQGIYFIKVNAGEVNGTKKIIVE